MDQCSQSEPHQICQELSASSKLWLSLPEDKRKEIIEDIIYKDRDSRAWGMQYLKPLFMAKLVGQDLDQLPVRLALMINIRFQKKFNVESTN